MLVSLNDSAGVALGIDFGHRHLRVAVSDLSHTVLAETWRELNVDHSAAHGLDAAADFVDQVLDEAGVERSRVIGVGMGLPAPIDRSTGAVQDNSILPGWVGVDAAAEASRRLGMPVEVENDANLGALAELVWGAAVGRSEVAYLKVATGIGGGLLSKRQASARDQRHGRRDRPHGARSPTARSAAAATAAASRPWHPPARSPNLLSASRGEQVSTRRLLELCAAGDAAAQRLIADAGRALGVAVANLCNLVNPECVIIGGDLSAAGDILLQPIREVVSPHRHPQRGRLARDRPGSSRRARRDARRPRPSPSRIGSFLCVAARSGGGVSMENARKRKREETPT